MPELVPGHAALARLSGGGDRAARFLSTWCPPAYLGGCSLAAHSQDGVVRLVRNYDLSPDLNEGLLLRSEWTGGPVMGMVEFLWGLSDGINEAGLAVALAFGGNDEVREGFGSRRSSATSSRPAQMSPRRPRCLPACPRTCPTTSCWRTGRARSRRWS
jgi:predicted choloylglycine hydrolase